MIKKPSFHHVKYHSGTSEKVSLCTPYDYPFYRAWENGNSKSVNGIRELLIKGIHVSDTINSCQCIV